MLTDGPGDEGAELGGQQPELIFQRTDADGRTALLPDFARRQRGAADGIPQGGSDPDWSGLMD